MKLAAGEWEEDPALAAGVNVRAGTVIYTALKERA
jgi:hypothetical protein